MPMMLLTHDEMTRRRLYGGGVSPIKQVGQVDPGNIAVFVAEGIVAGAGGAGSGFVSEAPTDGFTYTRNGLTDSWVRAFTRDLADALYAPASTVPFPEAPKDGQDYARNGLWGTWVPVTVATGGVPEVPATGGPFVRNAGAWVPLSSVTQNINGGSF